VLMVVGVVLIMCSGVAVAAAAAYEKFTCCLA